MPCHPRRTSVLLLAALVGLGIAALPSLGDDPVPSREIWRFTDGANDRQIDVTDLPAFVREAVVKRLAEQGFARVEGEARRALVRDLDADIRDLVRNRGRLLPSGEGDGAWTASTLSSLGAVCRGLAVLLADHLAATPGSTQAEAHRAGLRDVAAILARVGEVPDADLPERLGEAGDRWARRVAAADAAARRPVPFLGAEVARDPAPGRRPSFRVASVPPGSLAAAIGLSPGDEIAALDGRPPRFEALARWARIPSGGGKLVLGLLRRRGRIETWEIRVVPETAPRQSVVR